VCSQAHQTDYQTSKMNHISSKIAKVPEIKNAPISQHHLNAKRNNLIAHNQIIPQIHTEIRFHVPLKHIKITIQIKLMLRRPPDRIISNQIQHILSICSIDQLRSRKMFWQRLWFRKIIWFPRKYKPCWLRSRRYSQSQIKIGQNYLIWRKWKLNRKVN